MELTQLLSELNASMIAGDTIDLAYYGGTRQGQVRPLVIKEIHTQDNYMLVSEQGWPELKTYVLHRILWFTNKNGDRFENSEAIQKHSDFLRSIEDKGRNIESLRTGRTQLIPLAKTLTVAAEVPARMDEKAVLLYAIGMPMPILSGTKKLFFSSRTAMIFARDRTHAEKVCGAVEFVKSDEYSTTWNVLDLFLAGRVVWPVWDRMHRAIVEEGKKLRGRINRLCDRPDTLNSNGNVRAEPYNTQLEIYKNSELFPPTAGPCGYRVDRIRIFESDDMDTTPIFDLADRSSPGLISRYFYLAYCGFRVFDQKTSGFSDFEFRKLKELGLATTPATSTPETLLDVLPLQTLRSIAKENGLPKGSSGREEYRRFFLSDIGSSSVAKLRQIRWPDEMAIFSPPLPWTWEQYLDFRSCYIEMISALSNWLNFEKVHYTQEVYFEKYV